MLVYSIMEDYSPMKRKELLTDTISLMNPKGIMVNQGGQNTKECIFSLCENLEETNLI